MISEERLQSDVVEICTQVAKMVVLLVPWRKRLTLCVSGDAVSLHRLLLVGRGDQCWCHVMGDRLLDAFKVFLPLFFCLLLSEWLCVRRIHVAKAGSYEQLSVDESYVVCLLWAISLSEPHNLSL